MALRDIPGRLARAGIHALSDYVTPKAPPVERPEPGIYRSGRRDDYDTDRYARANLSPEKVGIILRSADAGDTARQFELWEKVEQDPRVGRLYLRRRQAVLCNPLRFEPRNPDDGKAVEAAELCEAAIIGGEFRGRELEGIRDLDSGLFNLTDAIGKAFAVAKVRWEVDGGLVVPTHMDRWPQSQFQLGDPTQYMAQDCDDIRVITDDEWNGKRLADFAAGAWVAHVQRTFSQPIARAGMFRSVTWYWMFKTFGMGDWSILLERYGIPPRKGTYAKDSDPKEQQELWTALLSMGKDHACMVPDGSTIELIEQKGQGAGGAPHPALVKHCNEEIAVAIAGNTMAVDQGDRGARSAKEAYMTEDLVQARFDSNGAGHGGGGLAGTIAAQLCRPLIRLNLGDGYPVPKVFFDLDNLEDLGSRIDIDSKAQKMGFPVTVGYIAEKYFDGEIPEGYEAGDLLEQGQAATAAALSLDDPGIVQLLALGAAKKKSMNWVLSRMRSRGE